MTTKTYHGVAPRHEATCPVCGHTFSATPTQIVCGACRDAYNVAKNRIRHALKSAKARRGDVPVPMDVATVAALARKIVAGEVPMFDAQAKYRYRGTCKYCRRDAYLDRDGYCKRCELEGFAEIARTFGYRPRRFAVADAVDERGYTVDARRRDPSGVRMMTDRQVVREIRTLNTFCVNGR